MSDAPCRSHLMGRWLAEETEARHKVGDALLRIRTSRQAGRSLEADEYARNLADDFASLAARVAAAEKKASDAVHGLASSMERRLELEACVAALQQERDELWAAWEADLKVRGFNVRKNEAADFMRARLAQRREGK